jgi:hypothetical protein
LNNTIFQDYFYHRQTIAELAIKHSHSVRWVRQQISAYQPEVKTRVPRTVTLVIDATFFGKRKDKFGVLVAKDSRQAKVLAYRFIQTEQISDYKKIVDALSVQGTTIKSITIDGKKGLIQAFEGVPVQMCHFHQQAIMTRYLTQNPTLPAAIDLRRVAFYLNKTSQIRFTFLLDAWANRHAQFLAEKTHNPETGRTRYTHQRVRSAHRSLRTNLHCLFTHQRYPNVGVPNTTNALDGGVFSPMKTLLRIHRGMGKDLKTKMIVDYLENH